MNSDYILKLRIEFHELYPAFPIIYAGGYSKEFAEFVCEKLFYKELDLKWVMKTNALLCDLKDHRQKRKGFFSRNIKKT